MAEKKMTQVEALEVAIKLMEKFAALDEQVEACEVLRHMVEKRKAPRKPRTNADAIKFREDIVRVLGEHDGPMTNAEIAEALEVNSQKVSNNIRFLVEDQVVVRTEGEKKSDKAVFSLA